jgi:electron transfer flavoprotein alpha subunit
MAESSAEFLLQVQEREGFDYWWAPHSSYGKATLPRLAGRLLAKGEEDIAVISDVTKVETSGEGRVIFERPIYAGNALIRVASQAKTTLITARPTAFAGTKDAEMKPVAEEDFKVELGPGTIETFNRLVDVFTLFLKKSWR